MALLTSSRYTTVQDSASSSVLAFRKQEKTAIEYTTYVAREGDTFESLATRIFKDPSQFWRIADANPQIKFPDQIPVGTYLRLPT